MPIHLRAARVNAGMTREEAAKSLAINKNTLASYEAYKTIPDVSTAKRIADLYGLTIDDIIFAV